MSKKEHGFQTDDVFNRANIVDTLIVPLAVAKNDNNPDLFEDMANTSTTSDLAWTSIELFGENQKIYYGL